VHSSPRPAPAGVGATGIGVGGKRIEQNVSEQPLPREPLAGLGRRSHEGATRGKAMDVGGQSAIEGRGFSNTGQCQLHGPDRRPGYGAIEAKRQRQGPERAREHQLPEAVEPSPTEPDQDRSEEHPEDQPRWPREQVIGQSLSEDEGNQQPSERRPGQRVSRFRNRRVRMRPRLV
jgi:hypothetical protein